MLIRSISFSGSNVNFRINDGFNSSFSLTRIPATGRFLRREGLLSTEFFVPQFLVHKRATAVNTRPSTRGFFQLFSMRARLQMARTAGSVPPRQITGRKRFSHPIPGNEGNCQPQILQRSRVSVPQLLPRASLKHTIRTRLRQLVYRLYPQ